MSWVSSTSTSYRSHCQTCPVFHTAISCLFETIRTFPKALLFLLQELDLRVASLVECFLGERVSDLAIYPAQADLAVNIIELTPEGLDLIFGLSSARRCAPRSVTSLHDRARVRGSRLCSATQQGLPHPPAFFSAASDAPSSCVRARRFAHSTACIWQRRRHPR